MAFMLSRNDADPSGLNKLVRFVLIASVVLLMVRLSLAEIVGYGDAEALYVVYGLYPRAGYLEHPALIGWLSRLIADANGVPSPATAHRLTAIASTTIPYLGGFAARAMGASWRGVMAAVLSFLLLPQMAIGLFAFTPDLPLAVFWILALALGAIAIQAEAGSNRALAATLGAGLCIGAATMAKVSGVLLGIGFLVTWLARPMRGRFRTAAPYGAMAAALICVSPLVMQEIRLGFPMLHHRLVASQVGFGPSLRNVGALVGGQLLYVTPFMLIAAGYILVDLVKRRKQDAISRLLFWTSVIPLVALSILTLLSRVAEPHWIAPAYVALVLHFARRFDDAPSVISRRLTIASVATAIAAIAIVFAFVRYPVLPKVMGSRYNPRWDITTDLYAWREGAALVREELDVIRGGESSTDVAIIGPHWVICAQVQAALGNEARVGCDGPFRDEFDVFYPRDEWRRAKTILYVTDDRFDANPLQSFPERAMQSVSRIGIRRGGVIMRTIRVMRLGRMGAG